AFYGGTSSANTAWVRLDSRPSTTPQVALSINGTMDPVSVPEPATMGLLGLGALAMVLRRKMSK
ncbi:MAG TPA: PEP-CTERM sorting domain-containing protein, partial [Kiritimatiellia bacterium]|nr:PEP-CTERM sorting domain-containing protein [Kiritimatiellia bacterium]